MLCGAPTPMVRMVRTNGADGLLPCKIPIIRSAKRTICILHGGGKKACHE